MCREGKIKLYHLTCLIHRLFYNKINQLNPQSFGKNTK